MKRLFVLRALLPLAIALALQGCGTPRPAAQPRDEEVRAALQRGQRAFSRQQHDMALHAFQCALRRARMLDDPASIGDSAHNLATVLVALGQYDDAQPYLDAALAAFTRPGARAGWAEIRVLMARVAIARRNPATAHDHLAHAAEMLTGDLQRSDIAATIHLLHAELFCDANDPVGAHKALEAAVAAGARTSARPAVRAQTATAEGRLAALNGAQSQAARHYDTAATAYAEAGRPRQVAQSLTAAAMLFKIDGETTEAADRYYRAARSYHAQGLLRPAVDQVMAAVAAAKKSGDAAQIKKTNVLFESVREALRRAVEEETKQ